jgi:parvulin-like peptidyl-prolyl cis-trans isomerase-like protein
MRWPNWLREPLLHFLVLGGLLFAIDHFISGRADDPRTIYVDARVDSQARQVFTAARGREPNRDELYALRRVWLDNEVLYREGLALGMDKGDNAIRERVIFKMLSVVDAGVKLARFDDKVLRAWFEKNRARYDEPARYDFQEAVLSGDRSEAAVRAFTAAVRSGVPGDARAGLRVFKGRPHGNLLQSYGPEFVKALEESPPGEWCALSDRDGWRLIRLDAITPPKPAVFETLRGMVLQDWTDATMAEQRTAAVRALARKYIVKVEAEAK